METDKNETENEIESFRDEIIAELDNDRIKILSGIKKLDNYLCNHGHSMSEMERDSYVFKAIESMAKEIEYTIIGTDLWEEEVFLVMQKDIGNYRKQIGISPYEKNGKKNLTVGCRILKGTTEFLNFYSVKLGG